MIDKKYNLLSTIGTGGCSKIMKAEDFLGKIYAIKTIRKEKKYSAKIEASLLGREFGILNSLTPHPNIITTHDISLSGLYESEGISETGLYAALEYAENGALSSFIKETGPLEEEIVRFYAYQMAHAIKHIHDHGFAHLDLKLENILLDGFFNAKVADFGGAVDVKETWGFTGHKRGTYIYMPPEIADLSDGEEYNAYAADMYSLGATLYIMLTGTIPKRKTSIGKLLSFHSNKSLQTVSSVSEEESKNVWPSEISQDAKYLIEALTDCAEEMRPTAEELLEDGWLSRPFSDSIKDIVFGEMKSRKDFMEAQNSSSFEDIMSID